MHEVERTHEKMRRRGSRGHALSLLAAWSSICCWAPASLAVPYVISQTQTFLANETKIVNESDMNGARQLIKRETDDIHVPFFGAPSSLVLAGRTWEFVGVDYSLSSTLWYSYDAFCRTGSFFSDCLTKAVFQVSTDVGQGGVVFPGQNTSLYEHFPVSLEAEFVSPFPFFEPGSDHDRHTSPTIPIEQAFSLSASDHDLSFLDVEDFTVQLQQVVIWGIADRDTGDDENDASAVYRFDGSIRIDFRYSPVPEPGTFWLLGSGLIVFALRSLGKKPATLLRRAL